jgi:hypothetical protein
MPSTKFCQTDDSRSIYQRITIEEAKARLRSHREPPWENIDAGILPIVRVLFEEGIETYESCQGGPGHCFLEPTVRFHGGISEGMRALAIALAYNLQPTSLRRSYAIIDKEPVGPDWEMTFHIPSVPGWRNLSA